MDTIDHGRLTTLRASLSTEFTALNARLRELTAVPDVGEAHNQAAMLASTRQSLDRVGGALRRIDEGTYGNCEKCAAGIPAERLEVLPHARFCVPCQQKHHG